MQETNGVLANGNGTSTSEAALLRRALTGDHIALEMLFARNNRALYQTALRLLGNPEDAEDALQEGMLAAYRNLRHFEGRSQFSTWLTRIVINAALMRRRSRRAHPAVSLDDCDREEQVPAVGAISGRGAEPRGDLCGLRTQRAPPRKPRGPLAGAAPRLRVARHCWTYRRRSRESPGRLTQYAKGASLARSPPVGHAVGRPPRTRPRLSAHPPLGRRPRPCHYRGWRLTGRTAGGFGRLNLGFLRGLAATSLAAYRIHRRVSDQFGVHQPRHE